MELLVVMVVVGVLALVMMNMPAPRAMTRALRIQCVVNLKQIGLAYRIWAEDNGTNYPMAVSETNGGTMGFVTGANAFRHYQAMSNELSTPRILICPSDDDSRWDNVTTNWIHLSNSNISYFVGVDAVETNATMILSGDRNITNGMAERNGLLPLTTNTFAGWTSDMHKRVGNVLLADGSVQQDSISGLQNQIAMTGVATNWMQMPVIGP